MNNLRARMIGRFSRKALPTLLNCIVVARDALGSARLFRARIGDGVAATQTRMLQLRCLQTSGGFVPGSLSILRINCEENVLLESLFHW
jgi:hypothetical protein